MRSPRRAASAGMDRLRDLGAQLTSGLRYIWHHETLLSLFMFAVVTMLLGQSYQQLLPAYALGVFDVGAAGHAHPSGRTHRTGLRARPVGAGQAPSLSATARCQGPTDLPLHRGVPRRRLAQTVIDAAEAVSRRLGWAPEHAHRKES